MKIAALIFTVAGLVSAGGCTNPTSTIAVADAGKKEKPMAPATKAELAQWQHATFAGGCFWCEEAVFESIKGVKEVVSGYSGGHTENPTYEESGTGRTGHAEAIEIYFDSTVVSFSSLVKVFMASIDPYQVNGQGPDRGSQYRTIIFYRNPAEKAVAEKALADPRLTGQGKVAVELKAFEKFWVGEDYHQDYVPQHPENPYVQHESIPRLKRTQAKVMDLVDPAKVAQ
jgi:peptide-methionine (S)-S-oxide reductase